MKNNRFFSCFTPPKLPPGLHHEPVAELAALGDPGLHFTTFENSIFVQNWTLVKLLG